MSPQCAFDKLSEGLEKRLTFWWGASVYFGLGAAIGVLWGWDWLDRYSYVTNSVFIILLVGLSRRDWLAEHAQMEKLLDDEKFKHLEKKTAIEIEEARS